ncbi:lytic transglycosylase domain-containing protein, partial [Shinella yambaruensis]
MIGLEIFIACAPNVAPATIEQIITVESAGDPLAINVNGGRLERKPESPADAAKMVYQYIANGHSVDMGLMQVNSRNLAALGYTVEEMFEPCTNISAGSRVLTQFYSAALRDYPDQQRALTAALSAYNTGNFIKGFENGYLARYGIHAQQAPVSVPAITPQSADTVV